MKPASFEYYDPTSVSEVLDLLGTLGEEARVLAGGQSLVPLMNLRLARPPATRGRHPGEPDKYGQLEDFVEVPVEWSYADPDDEDAIVAGLKGCDVYLGVIFKRKMGAAADSLKLIALHAAGYEKIDPESVPDGREKP